MEEGVSLHPLPAVGAVPPHEFNPFPITVLMVWLPDTDTKLAAVVGNAATSVALAKYNGGTVNP